jgi:hypothetical protein
MAQFQNVVITTRGQALMAKMMAGTGNVQFTRIATSSQVYTASQLEALTSLANQRQTTLVSRVIRVNNTSIRIEGAINNATLATGYFCQTVGVFALDPQEGEILYGVTIVVGQADWIPPFNNTTSTGIRFELVIAVGNAANVSLQVDPAAVATVGDLDRIYAQIADIQGFIGYTEDDIFGIDADFRNNRFTRLAGAVNRTAGAMFDGINAFGGRRRCIVADDGIILAYHGDAAYTETGRLIQSVTVGSTTYPVGASVQVMVFQPKFYYRVVPLVLERIAGSIGFHMRRARYYVSDTLKSGFKVHPAFIKDGTERPFVLIGAYEGCLQRGDAYNITDEQNGIFTAGTGDKLSSIANAKPVSGLTQNLTRRNCGITGENRGANWSQTYTAIASLTQMLMVIEYCSFNTRTAIGSGVISKPSGTGNESELTGQTALLGNASGMAQGQAGFVSVSYRGEENPWGNIWIFIDGMNVWGDGTLRGGVPHIADNGFAESIRDGKYRSAGFSLSNNNGYISAMGYGEPDFDWLMMASESVGSSSLPVGSHQWVTPDLNTFRIAPLGGSWDHSVHAGGFAWSLSTSVSHRSRTIGGRLVYVPPVQTGT